VTHHATGGLDPAAEQLLRAQLDDAIADANRTVSRAEAIGRYAIADEPLSLAAGSLTPTTKVRRAVVLERFAATSTSSTPPLTVRLRRPDARVPRRTRAAPTEERRP
jgi:hypothetical protein